ncbi:TIR domain-containing protein [Brevundimonas diminuta]|uniref:TIR domain-containing protein n=1 Tax=Brevundimonas diminuta TaxID=293 RepID=UPI003F7D407A
MLVTESLLREQASVLQKSVKKSAGRILTEQADVAGDTTFDVFLSHSKADEQLILGARILLENHGFSVYVDWLEDPHLDRSQVSTETADVLKQRMNQCGMLVYAHSLNSAASTWMPWELGYFDGKTGKVAILPIVPGYELEYGANEYLGLYPYLDYFPTKTSDEEILWVNRSFNVYADLESWLRKNQPIRDHTPT